MATTGLVGFKQSNERKTVFMMILFPVFLFVICLLVMYFFVTNTAYDSAHRFAEGLALTGQVFVILLPLIIIRGLVTFFWQKDLMFHFAGAKELTRAENPDIYNTVENLCISRGLPMPKIWIIETSGLNAFATGRRTKDSRIVFTSGLLETLNKREIEAVAAHELSHIINKDSMLMLVTVVFIGIVSILGEVLIRIRVWGNSKDNRAQLITMVAGLAFLLLGYLVYPLIRLAISRKREYLADAGSVELTKDNEAMISALQKISGHSFVPSANKNIAMFFIDSPQISNEEVMWKKIKKSTIRDTHPSVEERISVLEHY